MKTRDIVLCGLFAVLIAVMAQIAIPLPGGVPFSLQVMAVAMTGIILGPKRGIISVIIYILMGAIGLPVFANFSGGLSIIAGPTGGFILSFPIMALVAGLFSKKSNNIFFIFLGVAIGATINYLVGTVQFMLITKSSFMYSLTVCVVPFVIFDAFKWGLASLIGVRIKINKTVKAVLKV